MSFRSANRSGLKAALVFQAKSATRWDDQSSPLPCRILYLRGSEGVIAGRLRGVNTVIVRIRASAARTAQPSWRLKDKGSGRVYNIQSMQPSTCGRWLDIMCQTGTPS